MVSPNKPVLPTALRATARRQGVPPRRAQATLASAADPAAPVASVEATEPYPGLVIPLQDLDISLAVPPGWVAVGAEELAT